MYSFSCYIVWPLGGTKWAFITNLNRFKLKVVSVAPKIALVKYESCLKILIQDSWKSGVFRHVWIAGLSRCTNHCTSQCTLFELAIWNHRKRLHTVQTEQTPLRCWSHTCGHSIKAFAFLFSSCGGSLNMSHTQQFKQNEFTRKRVHLTTSISPLW